MSYFEAWIVVNDTNQVLLHSGGKFSIFSTRAKAREYIKRYKKMKLPKKLRRGRKITKCRIIWPIR